jgi:hypothetical protein
MNYPVMRPGAQRQLKKIGNADLVIGLPTYKNPATAAAVARVALEGIYQYYPHLNAVLINADAGYNAATRQAVAAQTSRNGHSSAIITGRYNGVRGLGSAVAALLDAALALDARAIIILDTHTQSMTPNWVAGLAQLILENKADLVMPRYYWPTPEGMLSDLIVYPLFRALWGRSVRHPAAPDFALSPALANVVLDQDIWETEVATWGLSPWLTTYAVLEDWRVAQSAVGEKQTPLDFSPQVADRASAKKAEAQFTDQFQNIVSTLLRQLYNYEDRWADVEAFYSSSTLTRFAIETHSDPALDQDPTPLLDKLALGWMEYRVLWQRVLTPKNLAQLEALAALPPDRFYFPADLWARIIYDFAVVFNKGDCDPYQVALSLYPLYQGRLAAFWQEIAGLASVGREGTIAAQAVEFEESRAYLKLRWHTYTPWS